MTLRFIVPQTVVSPVDATFYLGASTDDGGWRSNGTFLDNTVNSTVGNFSGTSCHAWYRFDAVTIPVGATINTAYLQVVAHTNDSDMPNLGLYFRDEDDALNPTSAANADAMSLTSKVLWTPSPWSTGDVVTSSNIASILQTIIDRGGWTSGNHVLVAVKDDANALSVNTVIRHAEYPSTPQLIVNYTPSA